MAAPRCRPLAANRARGAALIILMALLAMGVLYFVTMQLEAVSLYQKEALQGGGRDSLTQAREALLGHATTYRDDPTHTTEVFGYLPCPDTDGDGDSDAPCGAAGKASIGLFPFKTLGLPDLRDSTGACLWYAVAGSFKNSPKATVTVMNSDTQGQFRVRDAGGNTLVEPDNAEGGAAAVVFAAGPPLSDQNRSTGADEPCRIDPSQIAAHLEGYYENNAVTAYTAALAPSVFANPDLTTGTINLTQGPAFDTTKAPPLLINNDRLVWITPREIFDRVKGRSDFAAAINTLSTELVASLTPPTPGAPLTSHDPGDALAVGSKLVGKFPAPTNVPASYLTYRESWRDMYRYVRCTPSAPTNKCLTLNTVNPASSVQCMGALIFAGQKAAAGPRTTAEKANDTTYLEPSNYSAYMDSDPGPYTLTGASSFAVVNPAQDVLYCLNSPDLPLTTITGTGGFAVAANSPLVNSFAGSGRLGTTTTSVSDRSACTWSPTAVDFLNGLSVYFKLTINTRDAGLTFAVADATNNTSTVNLCGGIGPDGQYLGYAGTHSSGNRITAPKIALELDTRRDILVATDTDFAISGLGRHAALAYWGTSGSSDDDNTHGTGTAASDTQPLNPSAAPGIAARSFNNGTAYHVRLDIQRSYTAPLGTYSMTAYIYQTGTSLACTSLLGDPASLSDFFVNIDTNGFCTPTISNTITINDGLTGGSEAMKKVYLGFTNGQRAGRAQDISIGNFMARNRW